MCVCLPLFRPKTQVLSLRCIFFIYTHSHLIQMFFFFVYILLSYPLMMYYLTLSYWCTHDVKVTVIFNFLSVWHWLENTAKEKNFTLMWAVDRSFSPFVPFDPTSCLLSTVCLSDNIGTGNSGKWHYIFGAIILWKLTTMLSLWCLYLVPFLVIKEFWNSLLSCI